MYISCQTLPTRNLRPVPAWLLWQDLARRGPFLLRFPAILVRREPARPPSYVDTRRASKLRYSLHPIPTCVLRLAGGADQPLSLLVDSDNAPPPPLAEAVRAALGAAAHPLSRTALRQRLRVFGDWIGRMQYTNLAAEQRGLAVRGPNGWRLPP